MDRRNFLTKLGIGAAVITAAPKSIMPIVESRPSDVDIFFAKLDGSMYLLFRNRDRIFKETKRISDDEYSDMQDLKQMLVDHLIDYYGQA